MINQVQKGKEDLKKTPSLRLQCWNATRWLGRSECLNSICRAYEYILEHLAEFADTSSELKKDRQTAADLYRQLTTYDTFLFIFLYRDLAATMAKTSKLLQLKDIRIRDVGRQITSLCKRLEINYPETTFVPTPLLGEGVADDIIYELFGTDLDRETSNAIAILTSKTLMCLKKIYICNNRLKH